MPFTQLKPGLFHVHYENDSQLAPAAQAPLVSNLERAARTEPGTGILFEVHPDVRRVALDVPTYWLAVTARSDLKLRAIAVVSDSVAVRAAAHGFAMANTLRGIPTTVSAFRDVAAARAWIEPRLQAAPPAR